MAGQSQRILTKLRTNLGVDLRQSLFEFRPCKGVTFSVHLPLTVPGPLKRKCLVAAFRLPGVFVFYLRVILLCQLLVTLVHFIALQSMSFVAFSVGTSVPFVTVLKLSMPHIHTSEWVRYKHSSALLRV